MYIWINNLIVKPRAGWRLAELVPVAAAEEEELAAVALRGAGTVEWGAPVDPSAQQGAARAVGVVELNGEVRSWSSLQCRSARGICWSTAKFWPKEAVFSVYTYFYIILLHRYALFVVQYVRQVCWNMYPSYSLKESHNWIFFPMQMFQID